MIARDLRYDFFDEISSRLDIKHILTAHHLNDSLESFLINISRGSGLDGLTGICLLYTSPSPRDRQKSRMPSSA